uniref:hypothetical protein n=1 Tax=Pappia fissilis TaxID=1040649 RepID=UPI002A81F94B|nr:hypothetical protein UYP79_mgp041 [Pappia fissilis]WOX61295.1 hypothetical protein [Pappia fissilis]
MNNLKCPVYFCLPLLIKYNVLQSNFKPNLGFIKLIMQTQKHFQRGLKIIWRIVTPIVYILIIYIYIYKFIHGSLIQIIIPFITTFFLTHLFYKKLSNNDIIKFFQILFLIIASLLIIISASLYFDFAFVEIINNTPIEDNVNATTTTTPTHHHHNTNNVDLTLHHEATAASAAGVAASTLFKTSSHLPMGQRVAETALIAGVIVIGTTYGIELGNFIIMSMSQIW